MDWELVPRTSSAVLIDTPDTLPRTLLAGHEASPPPELFVCDVRPCRAGVDWVAAMVEAEAVCRRRTEATGACHRLSLLRASNVPDLQAKAAVTDGLLRRLVAEEAAVRESLALEADGWQMGAAALAACSAAEAKARQFIMAESSVGISGADCDWEVVTHQTVRFCMQWDQMFRDMAHTLFTLECRHRHAALQEQRYARATLRQQQDAERRHLVMRRRYPNAPEVLGAETPLHAMLRGYRFPADNDSFDAALGDRWPDATAGADGWEGAGAMDAVPEGAPANRGLLSLLKAMRA